MSHSDFIIFILFLGFLTSFFGYKRLIDTYYRKIHSGIIEGVYEVLCFNFKDFDSSSGSKNSKNLKTSRNIEPINELQKRYIKKFISLREHNFNSKIQKLETFKREGSKESSNTQLQIYISRRFWRCIEYTVAELIINFAKNISRTKDSYIHILFRYKIEEFINLYSKLFTNNYYKQLSKESLYLRVLQNICFVNNRSTPEVLSIVSIIESEFMKHYVNIHKLFENYGTRGSNDSFDSLNLFTLRRESLEFWEPDLTVNLKKLQKLNFNIIDL